MAKNTGRGSRAVLERAGSPRTSMWDSGGGTTGRFQRAKASGGAFGIRSGILATVLKAWRQR